MLSNARQILVSELVLAEATDKENVEQMINDKIEESFTLYKASLE